MREHRAAVEALADKLVERDVLSAQEVYAIPASHGVKTGRTVDGLVMED